MTVKIAKIAQGRLVRSVRFLDIPFVRLVRLPDMASRLVRQHLDELSHDLELILVRTQEDNRLKVTVDWLEGDPCVTPRITVLLFLALIPLYGVTLSGLGIRDVAELDEHGLTLPRALDRPSEEAPRAVGDRRLHGLANDLGNEHTWAQAVARIEGNPIKAVVLYMLRIAEGTGCGLERYERYASNVALLRFGLDDTQPRRCMSSEQFGHRA